MTRKQGLVYHINNSGDVGICRAKQDRCPYGSRIHFNDRDEAYAHAESLMSVAYGVAPGIRGTRTVDEELEDKDSMTSKMIEAMDVRSRGFEYECYGSSMYAEQMGLNKAFVLSEEYGMIPINSNDGIGEMAPAFSKAIEAMESFYEDKGVKISGDKLVRAVYYSDADEAIIVQSGSPDALDAHLVKPDGTVEGIEIKKTHGGGAQINSMILETSAYGQVNVDGNDSRMSNEIRNAANMVRTEQIIGTNKELNLSDEEAMTHFISQYQQKGAGTLIYTDKHGRISYQDLKGDASIIASGMLDKGMKARVLLRMNYDVTNFMSGDPVIDGVRREQFENTTMDYIKPGVDLSKQSFKFSDIEKGAIQRTGGDNGFVRMGQYVLPIKNKDLSKVDDDFEIKFRNMSYYPVTLTGEIKTL